MKKHFCSYCGHEMEIFYLKGNYDMDSGLPSLKVMEKCPEYNDNNPQCLYHKYRLVKEITVKKNDKRLLALEETKSSRTKYDSRYHKSTVDVEPDFPIIQQVKEFISKLFK